VAEQSLAALIQTPSPPRILLLVFFLTVVIGCASTGTQEDKAVSTQAATTQNIAPVVTSETIVLEQPVQQKPVDSNLIPKAQPGFSSGAQQASTECLEMAKQLEALRNKPLRRSALQERYQAECKR